MLIPKVVATSWPNSIMLAGIMLAPPYLSDNRLNEQWLFVQHGGASIMPASIMEFGQLVATTLGMSITHKMPCYESKCCILTSV